MSKVRKRWYNGVSNFCLCVGKITIVKCFFLVSIKPTSSLHFSVTLSLSVSSKNNPNSHKCYSEFDCIKYVLLWHVFPSSVVLKLFLFFCVYVLCLFWVLSPWFYFCFLQLTAWWEAGVRSLKCLWKGKTNRLNYLSLISTQTYSLFSRY